MTPFGEAFRNIRRARNLLIKDIAEDFNVLPSVISSYDFGDRFPPAAYVLQIIEIYKLSPDEQALLRQAWHQTKLHGSSHLDTR